MHEATGKARGSGRQRPPRACVTESVKPVKRAILLLTGGTFMPII